MPYTLKNLGKLEEYTTSEDLNQGVLLSDFHTYVYSTPLNKPFAKESD